MSKPIAELLHRRSDLSTFLVHLTRTIDAANPRSNLLSILAHQTLEARSVLGMGHALAQQDEAFAQTQRVVCSTETPLEHVWMMCEEIENRALQFAPYGLALTKTWARRKGVNPVWYVDITVGHSWLTRPINELLELAARGRATRWDAEAQDAQPLPAAQSQAARLAPFVEQMGNPSGTRKEFWWEREWRHVGDLFFQWWDIVTVFAPEADHDQFQADLAAAKAALGHSVNMEWLHFLDPRWGLERMIASLARVASGNIGPFPA
jgi:hypothetical protein